MRGFRDAPCRESTPHLKRSWGLTPTEGPEQSTVFAFFFRAGASTRANRAQDQRLDGEGGTKREGHPTQYPISIVPRRPVPHLNDMVARQSFLYVNPPSARPIVNLGAHLLRALPLYRPRASLGGLFQAHHEGRSRMRTPHSRLDWPNPRVPLLSRGNAYSSGCGASGRLPGVSRLAVLVS